MSIILCSSCLLGLTSCENGKDYKINGLIETFSGHLIHAFCPEQLGGLQTPRTKIYINNGLATDIQGINYTDRLLLGGNIALNLAKQLGTDIVLLKDCTVSCGVTGRPEGSNGSKIIYGRGYATNIFYRNGLKIFHENQIQNLVEYLRNK